MCGSGAGENVQKLAEEESFQRSSGAQKAPLQSDIFKQSELLLIWRVQKNSEKKIPLQASVGKISLGFTL